MKNGITLAWAVGIGIISYRSVRDCRRPPMPGVLLASSGLFVGLALLEGPAPELAVSLAWGFVGAAWLNLGNVASPRCAGTKPAPASSGPGRGGPLSPRPI